MSVRTFAEPKKSSVITPKFDVSSPFSPRAPEPASETADKTDSRIHHNLGDISVLPESQSPGFKDSCPLSLSTPTRCPYGGACHTCPPKVQAKLKVGQPNDKYEQEADSVADRVMSMPEPKVQRQEENDDELQKQPEEDEELKRQPVEEPEEEPEENENTVSAKAQSGQTPKVTPGIESNINSMKGGGSPLPESTRSFMEPRFGHDFSKVRVHTDTRAADTASSIKAKAFTVGNNIAFNTGQYLPNSDNGKRLLGHELTHIVQQSKSNGAKDRCISYGRISTYISRSSEVIQRKKTKKRKLYRKYVKYANEELWGKHPGMKGRQLTKGRADAALRKEWWRYYNWGEDSELSKGNCYRYAFSDPLKKSKSGGETHSPFPGGLDPGGHIKCDDIMDGAKSQGATKATLHDPCGRGKRKIAGVIQDSSHGGNGNDFHWYRLEKKGYWTHKRGSGGVEQVDASGDPISDPATADRNYSGSDDYDKFCGYLCVPKNSDIDKKP